MCALPYAKGFSENCIMDHGDQIIHLSSRKFSLDVKASNVLMVDGMCKEIAEINFLPLKQIRQLLIHPVWGLFKWWTEFG